MTFHQTRTDGRKDGNFCGRRRRRGRGPADGAPAAAVAAAKIEKQITSGRPPVKKKLAPDGRLDEKKRKNQSASQTIDQVMAINSVQKSSKSELSSRGKRPFKVFNGDTKYFPNDFGRFRTIFGRFRIVFGRFRTVLDGFGRFRTVFGRFRTVFGRFRTVSDRFRIVSNGSGSFSDRFG